MNEQLLYTKSLIDKDIKFLFRFLKENHILIQYFIKLNNFQGIEQLKTYKQYKRYVDKAKENVYIIKYNHDVMYKLYGNIFKLRYNDEDNILLMSNCLIFSANLFCIWNNFSVCCHDFTEEHIFWRNVTYEFVRFKMPYFTMKNNRKVWLQTIPKYDIKKVKNYN